MKENLLKPEATKAAIPQSGEPVNKNTTANETLTDKFRGEKPQKTKYGFTEEGQNGRSLEPVKPEGDDAAKTKETDAAKSGGHTAAGNDFYGDIYTDVRPGNESKESVKQKITSFDVPEEIKNGIIKEYLIKINSANKESKMFLSGGGMRTPVKKPTSIEEAGKMVKKFLIDKEN